MGTGRGDPYLLGLDEGALEVTALPTCHLAKFRKQPGWWLWTFVPAWLWRKVLAKSPKTQVKGLLCPPQASSHELAFSFNRVPLLFPISASSGPLSLWTFWAYRALRKPNVQSGPS